MFQDFSARQFAIGQAEPPRRAAVEEATGLIDRYPNLSEIELARLINLYRDFAALDSALIISDQRLGPKLARFYADHRSKVRAPFRQYAALVLYGVLTIVTVVWAWSVSS
jgi:hypothetical protein